jgi:predicted restriction endonuclease
MGNKITKLPYQYCGLEGEGFKPYFNEDHYNYANPEYVPEEEYEKISNHYWRQSWEDTYSHEDEYPSKNKRTVPIKKNYSVKTNEKISKSNSSKGKSAGGGLGPERNRDICQELKTLYDYTCQCCGIKNQTGPTTYGMDAHHLHPLGMKGKDSKENMIVICPNCHRLLDDGGIRINPETFVITHFNKGHSLNGVELVKKHHIDLKNIIFQNNKYVEEC